MRRPKPRFILPGEFRGGLNTMSVHRYPQGYRYRSAAGKGVVNENLGQDSDSDVADLTDLEDGEDEDEEDDEDEDEDEDDEDEERNDLPYPGFAPVALRYLDQMTRPRNWCLALITNPYPFLTIR